MRTTISTLTSSVERGPLSDECRAILRPKDGTNVRIRDGFHLVFSSCFEMNTWKNFLRGKLPLGEVQPVQMSRSIQQLAEVMRDGIPADGTDDALSEMDRLADML